MEILIENCYHSNGIKTLDRKIVVENVGKKVSDNLKL